MKRLYYPLSSILVIAVILSFSKKDQTDNVYRYWPAYKHLEFDNVDTITSQKWIGKDHLTGGWDFSLPDFVEPSPTSAVGLQRLFSLDQEFKPISLKFKSNAVGVLWIKWRDLEPKPGKFNFKPLLSRIKQANNVGVQVILRIVGHSKMRGYGPKAIEKGDAPLWLEKLGVDLLNRRDSIKFPNDNLNFNPANPIFHKRYLMLVEALAKTEIPKLVKANYIGYASPSYGDEGIGPFEGKENDTIKHVRERLDAWQSAFSGMENKIFMGGPSQYGYEKGFGVRRGFVEMYMYNIPNEDLGQYIDDKGYLIVDENAPILKYNSFNGDENEEYEPMWATSQYQFRFGTNTNSFPYRYFMSNLRALQMRCSYLLLRGHLLPQMIPFLSLELGRTVDDAPDVWTFLNTGYIRSQFYKHRDYRGRIQTDKELTEGIECKNFERWLYQRDAPGYETEPAIKIPHAIQMWMMQNDKYFDYIARSGAKMGFDIDDNWDKSKAAKAVKITFFDNYSGGLILKYNGGKETKFVQLAGDNKLKTVTFFVKSILPNSMDNGFDFTLEASRGTEKIVVSMVRVVEVNSK